MNESLEFYNCIKEHSNLVLVDDFDKADYIIYMMDLRNVEKNRWYKKEDLNLDIVHKIRSHTNYHKEIIIDYNDWVDTKNNIESHILPKILLYFKRSMVDKTNLSLIDNYPKNIIPISYAIQNNYYMYDTSINWELYNKDLYDICCMFNIKEKINRNINREIIPFTVNELSDKYNVFVGTVQDDNKKSVYNDVIESYYNILKNSKIIVTCNPHKWEGDHRLWEALLTGNLVLCDEMVIPHIMKNPLINKKHIVFYKNSTDLKSLIDYYMINDNERIMIGKVGREYCLKYHTFKNRLDEIINAIKLTDKQHP